MRQLILVLVVFLGLTTAWGAGVAPIEAQNDDKALMFIAPDRTGDRGIWGLVYLEAPCTNERARAAIPPRLLERGAVGGNGYYEGETGGICAVFLPENGLAIVFWWDGAWGRVPLEAWERLDRSRLPKRDGV